MPAAAAGAGRPVTRGDQTPARLVACCAGPDAGSVAGEVRAGALGCGVRLFGESGGHLVPGGARLRDVRGAYLARVGPAVLVYCPDQLRRPVGRKRFADPDARSPGFAGYGQDLIARLPS